MRILAVFMIVWIGLSAPAQQTPVPSALPTTASSLPALEAVAPGLGAIHGKDAGSGITYARLFLVAGPMPAVPAAGSSEKLAPPDLLKPTLTAQCTQDRSGKLHFEIFANFGGVSDPAFYPPWHSTRSDLYPPSTTRMLVTLDFLGYRKVPSYKRSFEQTIVPSGQMRYLPPSAGSRNLEEVSWFLQYLRALPILQLTLGTQIASFSTAPLLAQLTKEPLCKAAGV